MRMASHLGAAQGALWRRLQTSPDAGAQTAVLSRHRLYILPTRHGLLFGGLLLVMLLGAINYNNSLGFVLTFLLSGMAVVSIFHTYRNLAGLRLRAGKAAPVFAGELAHFPISLGDEDQRARVDIDLAWAGGKGHSVDVPSAAATWVRLERRSSTRGDWHPGRFVVSTRYPLGLFRAWAWVDLALHCVVYPRPKPTPLPAVHGHGTGTEGRTQRSGTEDFSGLRSYRPGDSPRQIAWKALAKDQPLATKQFVEPAEGALWLDWDDLPGRDVEARLAVLCAWVLDAERRGIPYGLRMPGLTREPAHGEAHQRQCLTALARFG